MNKIFYIIGVLIILLLIAIGITWYWQSSSAIDPNGKGNDVPPVTPYPIKVNERNFLSSPQVSDDPNNPGHYFLGNTFNPSPVTGQPAYVITYDASVGFFNIALLKKPLPDSRREAETFLQQLLKIDNNDMCGLSYSLSVPAYVDEYASGIDYRFSFCQDSIDLKI